MNKFKQGDMVEYDVQVLKGIARIVGLSTNGAPVIGVGYILEDLSRNVPSDAYPFTHFCAFEYNLKLKETP